ncbi:MAG: anthranilate synthase component I family protein [Desulfovibrionaceae bacterium]|nr:anthranilate synthase component I family protein [Desulfovibrionaceae bacterium]
MSQFTGITLQQKARLLPADMDTPISLFMGMVGAGDGILLESAAVDGKWGRYSILACDMLLYISCRNGELALRVEDDRLSFLKELEGMPFAQGLNALMERITILPPADVAGLDLPPITRALYGYLGFEMAGLFNPKLAPIMPKEEAECQLALPGTVIVFDHVYNRLCQICLDEFTDVRSAHESSLFTARHDDKAVLAEPDAEGYKDFVRRIQVMLQQGEAIQCVPSVRFSTPWRGDGFGLYRRMRRINASPYMFYMHFPSMSLFGSSPEVMVRCSKDNLHLAPIAGTRRRGRDDAEDHQMELDLLSDPKERAEHVMLVDLGRNDLGRIAVSGSVRVESLMQIERFSHVMHLTSQVTARLQPGKNAVDVLASTFPAGTVSGAPKLRAIEMIREMEGRPRGPYAGCIGWIGLDKDSVNLDMGITIRSMWVRGGRLYWQAGGGIVHDSIPDLEWKEVTNKSAIMRLALKSEEEAVNVSVNR